ncbi:ribosylglycohydrolase [Streptomyces sp. NRRL F-5122]|nr:ribosylglycohydrolase [Streptomyces sp. NRRL F-5122]
MQVCIAEVAATGADLRTPEALDQIAANFQQWLSGGATDVGSQTRTVLDVARRAGGAPGAALSEAAREFTTGNDRAAGNGSLMRTGIVALAQLADAEEMAEAATAVSALTHPDPDCADACVLWCSGIRTAVLEGTFDGVRAGLDLLPAERRDVWTRRLDEAETHPPHHFTNNGWVVHALQAAWSAITRTVVPELLPAKGSFPTQHLHVALGAAVRAGTDTDTVAAIAGALLGARWGCSGIPLQWQQAVHGWPGHRQADLVRLAVLTARSGSNDATGWPSAQRMPIPPQSSRAFAIHHPHDPGVVLGNLALTQRAEPVPVDAVVSLCRVGTDPILPGADIEHVRVWLVDSQGHNANLHYVMDQAARQVLRLRDAGKRVLLHCAAGQSRTPAVAALYSNLATGTDAETALNDLRQVLTGGWHLDKHPEMQDAVHELTAERATSGPSARNRETDGPIRDGQEEGRELPRERINQLNDAIAEPLPKELEPDRDATQKQKRRKELLNERGAPSRVRGLLLGLALGDTLGAAQDTLPTTGPLRAGVSTQLACFTAEGTIRAFVRGDHKGISSPPGVVWHAYCRWAALQGIEAVRMRHRWAGGSAGEAWPDGWLAQVPVLAERRGSAPSTVAALSKIELGAGVTPSRGCHALTRTIPLAVAAAGGDPQYWVRQAREVAALTHGDRAAHAAAAHATALVQHCLIGERVLDSLQAGLCALPSLDQDLTDDEHNRLTAVLRQTKDQTADVRRLAQLAPDATAPSALLGGLYVAASFPLRTDLAAALSFAASAPDGDSVACVAGALLGAVHGAEALPVDLVSRHELAWVLDTLARDLVAQLTDRPSGTEYNSGWDPHWWGRYPGW